MAQQLAVPTGNPQVETVRGGQAPAAIDATEARRRRQASDVALTGAPVGRPTFLGFGIRMQDSAEPMVDAIISNPAGRLLNWLHDFVDPSYDEPLKLNGGPGGFVPANGVKAMGSFQMQEMAPRIGVFRRDPSTFVRLMPNHTPPAAAARVAQYPNTGSPGKRWTSTVLPPPVLGRRVIRWPRVFPDYPTFSGEAPDA